MNASSDATRIERDGDPFRNRSALGAHSGYRLEQRLRYTAVAVTHLDLTLTVQAAFSNIKLIPQALTWYGWVGRFSTAPKYRGLWNGQRSQRVGILRDKRLRHERGREERQAPYIDGSTDRRAAHGDSPGQSDDRRHLKWRDGWLARDSNG
jgi:hypothetical protein